MRDVLVLAAVLPVILLMGCLGQPSGSDGVVGDNAGANVYLKDQSGDVEAVTATVTKVEFRKADGTFETVFEGSSQVRLEAGTVEQVASSRIDAATYTGVRIEFGDSATVENADGTTAEAEIVRRQFVVNWPQRSDSQVDENETVNVVVDIALETAVKVLPNGKVNFTPDAEAKADLWTELGIKVDSSVNATAKARTVVDASVLDKIKTKTNLGANIGIGIGLGTGDGSMNGGSDAMTRMMRDAGCPDGSEVQEVEVTARRFAFEPNPIVLSSGKCVHFTLHSMDVPHGFAVDALGISESITPGNGDGFYFYADPAKVGEYELYCNKPCGTGHAGMRGTLTIQ